VDNWIGFYFVLSRLGDTRHIPINTLYSGVGADVCLCPCPFAVGVRRRRPLPNPAYRRPPPFAHRRLQEAAALCPSLLARGRHPLSSPPSASHQRHPTSSQDIEASWCCRRRRRLILNASGGSRRHRQQAAAGGKTTTPTAVARHASWSLTPGCSSRPPGFTG